MIVLLQRNGSKLLAVGTTASLVRSNMSICYILATYRGYLAEVSYWTRAVVAALSIPQILLCTMCDPNSTVKNLRLLGNLLLSRLIMLVDNQKLRLPSCM